MLVSATVALILLLQDDNPDLIQQFDSYGAKQPDDGITFDEFINSEFSYKTFNGSWWDTTELQWKNEVKYYRCPLLLNYFVLGR